MFTTKLSPGSRGPALYGFRKSPSRLPGGIEIQIQRKALDRAGAIGKCEIVIDPILRVVLEQNSGKLVVQHVDQLRVRKRRIGGQPAAPSKRPAVCPCEVVDVTRYGSLLQQMRRTGFVRLSDPDRGTPAFGAAAR